MKTSGSMEESHKRNRIYTELPLYERFISKGRAGQPRTSADFAGRRTRAFPILKRLRM